jgi:tetratricopeptide (TPR) repeat protein
MMKVLFTYLITCISLAGLAQDTQDLTSMKEAAKNYIRQGDYNNALMVLNRAKEKSPTDLEIQKDLALTYYLQKDFAKAQEVSKTLVERPDADVPSFQIAGNIYKALEEVKDCERLYKKGLDKFPNSGALYSEYGELLFARKDYDAIQQWEKGIKVDPSYSGNYYNAAKYYYFTTDRVWSLIYGEVFVNLESLSQRTAEMKGILLDSYKKLYSSADLLKNYDQKKKNEFELAYLTGMNKQSSLTANGITVDNLIMVRTRFILDWFEKDAAKFPMNLFDYQRQLLQNGMFEAYNQWIFGAAGNLPQYQAWTNSHADAYSAFSGFQKSRVFKVPSGQYYQSAQPQ